MCNVTEWQGWCGFDIPSPFHWLICSLDRRKDSSNRYFWAWLLLFGGNSGRAEGRFRKFIPWSVFPLGHHGLRYMFIPRTVFLLVCYMSIICPFRSVRLLYMSCLYVICSLYVLSGQYNYYICPAYMLYIHYMSFQVSSTIQYNCLLLVLCI